MTFGQLNTFVALARTGSVRGAAAALVVTEPAVSAAVSALQRDLGVELVTRQGRGIVLTPAGETLARYAEELLGLRDQALREIREVRALRLRLTTAGEYVVPPILKAFRAERPDVEVSLEVGNRSEVFGRLARRRGRPRHRRQPAGRRRHHRRPVPRLPAGGGGGRRPCRRRPRPRDLAAARTRLRIRATVEAYLQDHGMSPPTMTLGSNGAVKQAVAVGLGITLLSTTRPGRS